MIQEFYVSNFLSIKDRQGISFVANNMLDDTDKEYLMIPVSDSLKLMKIGLLYGYNAAGKSNILYAFNYLRKIVLSFPKNKDEVINEHQFALVGKDEPTSFELIFITDERRYLYHVEISSDKILSEELKIYPLKGKKTSVFSRKYDTDEDISKISFGSVCGFRIAEKNALIANTLNNATLFSAYLQTNVTSDIISDALSFFKDQLMNPIGPSTNMIHWSLDRIENDDVSKNTILSLMKKADLQIEDMKILKKPVPTELIEEMKNRNVPDEIIEGVKTENSRTLIFSHHTDEGDFDVEVGNESRGTIRYFGLAGILGTLIRKTAFICVDEIESALHPELIDFFLQLFLVNSKKSQIFATTHNTSLLDLEYLRHDNYWFCEKQDNGASDYFSLQDFKIHKDLKISNLYKARKLGAVPDLTCACRIDMEDEDAAL